MSALQTTNMRHAFFRLLVLVLPIVGFQLHGAEIKNVLMLISDDLKPTTLGCYGDPIVKTPHIDSLAESGVLFRHAYCQGTTCRPSRQSFMFSRYKGDTGTSMGENFINNGFYSARVGKIFHMRVPGDIIDGTDGDDYEECWTERFNSQGEEAHTPGLYSLYNHDIVTTAPENRASTKMLHRWFVSVVYEGDGSDQPDHKTATKTIELLNQRKDAEEPFFIAAGFVRPHYPNVAPRQYFDMYSWQDIQLPHVPDDDLDDIPPLGRPNVTNGTDPIGKYPDNQKRMWAAYYATITFIDDQIGRILAELDRLGLRESTAIVFLSDHGYHLGEHTFWQKNNLHEDVNRVPLIISAPGYQTGETKSFAELIDIYPTIAELTGIPVPNTVQGKTLVPILKNTNAKVQDIAFTVGNHKDYAIRDQRWAYIRYKDDTEEFYDMKKDPYQYTNLASSPEHAPRLKAWRKRLDDKIASSDLSAAESH
ncbi:MAG: sulfatase [Verrucomicrobiota bacterium]